MNETAAATLATAIGKECIAVRVRVLSRAVTALYDREVRPLGLKANQCTILVCLARAGQLDQSGISRALKMEKSTVSRGIERMKVKGWIEETGPDDRRLRLTPAGRAMLGRFHVAWLRAQQNAKALVGADAVEHLNQLTSKLLRR